MDGKNKIFKAFIFDMDGLMLDSEGLTNKAWQKAALDFGYNLTDEVMQALGIEKEGAR